MLTQSLEGKVGLIKDNIIRLRINFILPIWHLSPDFDSTVTYTCTMLSCESCALDRVDDRSCCCIAHSTAGSVIAIPVKLPYTIGSDEPIVRTCDVESAVCDVVDGAIKDRVQSDVVRRQGRYDVKLSIANKGIVS